MPPLTQPPVRFNWPLAFTIVAVLLIGVGSYFGFLVLRFFRPNIVVNERMVTTTAVSELSRRPKLVVLSAKVTAWVEAENDSEWSLLGISVPRGRTKVALRSTANQVQFVIPLEAFGAEQVRFDSVDNELVVTLPQPVVDPDLVEIDQFPEVRTDVGWSRLDSRSGEALRTKAKQGLREAVLQEASTPVYLGAARDAGRSAVMSLLGPAIAKIPGTIHVRIEFAEPPARPKG